MTDREWKRLVKLDAKAWLPYADWLEEQGRSLDAAKARAQAGISEVVYVIRHTYEGEEINPCNYRRFGSISGARNSIRWLIGIEGSIEEYHIDAYERTYRKLGEVT